MRPTTEQCRVVARTITTLKFFPAGMAAHTTYIEVIGLLERMAGTVEALEWFRETIRNHVSEWPGLAELRAIYCTAYRPLDGVEAVSALPGFTGADLDADYQRRIGAENEKKLLEWKAGKPKQIEGDTLPLQIEAAAGQKQIGRAFPPPRPAPDPDAETRRATIADEFERLRAEKIRNAMADISNDGAKQ